jgi:hypothetical protein
MTLTAFRECLETTSATSVTTQIRSLEESTVSIRSKLVFLNP